MKGIVEDEKFWTCCMIDSGNGEVEKGKNVWDENKLNAPPAMEIAVFSDYNIICFFKSTPLFFSENNKVYSKKYPHFLKYYILKVH